MINSEENNFNTNGEFDIGKFNTAFDKNKEKQKNIIKSNSEKRLNALTNLELQNNQKSNGPVINLFIEIKNCWFYLADDLLQQKFEIETFTKENRLFFIGITLIFFSTVLLCFNEFENIINCDNKLNNENNEKNKIIEKYYIYQNIPNVSNISNTMSVLN